MDIAKISKWIGWIVFLLIALPVIKGCNRDLSVHAERDCQQRLAQAAASAPQTHTMNWANVVKGQWVEINANGQPLGGDVNEDNVVLETQADDQPPVFIPTKRSGLQRTMGDCHNVQKLKVRVAFYSPGDVGTYHYTLGD